MGSWRFCFFLILFSNDVQLIGTTRLHFIFNRQLFIVTIYPVYYYVPCRLRQHACPSQNIKAHFINEKGFFKKINIKAMVQIAFFLCVCSAPLAIMIGRSCLFIFMVNSSCVSSARRIGRRLQFRPRMLHLV